MIYVMVGEMVFLVPQDQLKAEDSWRHILRRHVSYFADEDSLKGFLSHIQMDNPFFERVADLVTTFVPGDLRQPIEKWRYLEPDLKDLVSKMTIMDPARRITAKEALEHRWFNQTG